jgi:hypothetical protein
VKALRGLAKDKLQKLALAVILTVIGVLGVSNFYIRSNLAEYGKHRKQVADLTTELEAVAKSVKEEVNNTALRDQLKRFVEVQQQRMVTGDPFSWVVREVTLLAEKHPVKVLSLSPGAKAPHSQKSKFETYSSRLDVEGGYDQVGQFLSDMENHFPTTLVKSIVLAPFEASTGTCRASVELLFLIAPATSPAANAGSTPVIGKDV